MAPAMNTNMLEHEAVRRNLRTLSAQGVRFVEPGQGYLACGWVGKGRLAEPDEIVEAADRLVRGSHSLDGKRVVVTSGPTIEDIDAVRFIGNRSSGKMGHAIAAEAARRGAHVVLISGPTSLVAPHGVEVVAVRSAADMHAAVTNHGRAADIVVMAAAVADYTPARVETGKIEKSDGPMELTLVRTTDILAELGRLRRGAARPVLVGFAAEAGDPAARAREKLRRKNADLIVANDITRTDAGFDTDTNAVTLVSATGDEVVPLAQKSQIAATILDRAEALLAAVRA
jgi:phosphopantothenoylcysteine decarboxylase/phosphopantothenate--cysteine ligase